MVVGLRVEEAKIKVDRYINDCLLANLTTGTIIHGVGSGILRKALGEYLHQHPGVKSYKMADHQQGGAAATIITLR